MTGLIPILFLGTLILVFGGRLVFQWTRGNRAQPVTIAEYSRAREALDSVVVEASAIKRIFATDDIEFISRSGPGAVQRFFRKERKRLAIQWLRMTQKQVARLMDIHLKLASYTYEPSPTLELRLSIQYQTFNVASNVLLILLWCRGPFEASRLVAYTIRAAEYFCSVFSLRLDKTDPVKLGSAQQAHLV